jgi:hypothetical protein
MAVVTEVVWSDRGVTLCRAPRAFTLLFATERVKLVFPHISLSPK